jgi:hypothetical protein
VVLPDNGLRSRRLRSLVACGCAVKFGRDIKTVLTPRQWTERSNFSFPRFNDFNPFNVLTLLTILTSLTFPRRTPALPFPVLFATFFRVRGLAQDDEC